MPRSSRGERAPPVGVAVDPSSPELAHPEPSASRASSSQQPDFEKFDGVFGSTPTSKLLFAAAILGLCSKKWVLALGPKVLDLDRKIFPAHLSPSLFVVKHTFFRHFCSGETIGESMPKVEELYEKGLSTILDFSVEDALDDGSCDRNAQTVVDTVRLSASNRAFSFACVKLTGIVPHVVLERMTAHLRHRAAHPEHEVPWLKPTAAFLGPVLPGTPDRPAPPPLTAEELAAVERLFGRLERIAEACAREGVPLLIDAEWHAQQAAIDYVAFHFMERYNRERPLIYTTYQMYLKDAPARLRLGLQQARERGFHLGAKLVRGAYIVSERERAARRGDPSPCWGTIEETHAAYDEGVELMLRNADVAAVCLASHNRRSVQKAVALMREVGIGAGDGRVQFAQLFSMADYLSLSLGKGGFSVSKYVPFGPVGDVIPYLLRRIQENKDVLGGTQLERNLIHAELKRRLLPAS
eukprot:tig00001600_g9389.t1